MTAVDPRPVQPAAAPVAPTAPVLPPTPVAAAAPAAAAETAAAETVAPVAYVGLVTRALAFAIDAAIINAVALLVTAVVGLTVSVLKIPDSWLAVGIAAGGAVYLLWTVGYFAAFWSTTGQTPGNRALRIRVTAAGGGGFGLKRAIVRLSPNPPPPTVVTRIRMARLPGV